MRSDIYYSGGQGLAVRRRRRGLFLQAMAALGTEGEIPPHFLGAIGAGLVGDGRRGLAGGCCKLSGKEHWAC